MTEITYGQSIQLHYSGLEKDSSKLVLSQTYVTIFEKCQHKAKGNEFRTKFSYKIFRTKFSYKISYRQKL